MGLLGIDPAASNEAGKLVFASVADDPELTATIAEANAAAVKAGIRGAVDILNPLPAGYFDAAIAPTADLPTITQNVGASTIAGGSLHAALRLGDSTTNVNLAGDTKFRYDGVPDLIPVGALNTYVQPQGLPEGGAAVAYYMPGYEFDTPAANTTFELQIRPPGTVFTFRMLVDGVWMDDDATRITGLTAGSGSFIKFVFGTAKARRIKVFIEGAIGWRGVVMPAGQAPVRPTTPITTRIAIMGDSFTGGSGTPTDGAGRIETWANFIGKLSGAESLWFMGIGGSGWTTGVASYQSRAAAVLASDPDVLIVQGSRNDGNGNPAAIQAAVELFLDAVAAVPLVVVTGPSTTGYTVGNDAVKAGVLAKGRVFLDGIAGAWIGAGDIGTDTIHPTFAGHKKIADGFWRAFRPWFLTRNL